jgi:pimeloyl-ACP methyl ester carboxylesterase
MDRFTANSGIAAAVSQPGYGGSSQPRDCCGPRTQRALRTAFAHLVERGAEPAGTVVWGISRGAIAASCAFVDGTPEPALLILQAGTYDMLGWALSHQRARIAELLNCQFEVMRPALLSASGSWLQLGGFGVFGGR